MEISSTRNTGILKMLGTTNTIWSLVSDVEKNDNPVFEKLYTQLRHHENRIYTDAEVAALPDIPFAHPHAREWKVRKRSSQQLIQYLNRKNKPLKILEVGCGNGWFSAKLTALPSSHVTGIDVNYEELTQAVRVFAKIPNLEFLYGTLQGKMLKSLRFDIIVFASSIQYFSSLHEILAEAIDHLKPGGEIHIMDSPFYKQKEVAAARLRSEQYYESIRFPEMNKYYFHHCINELRPFNHKILYNPDANGFYLWKYKNPFYWICIKQ